MDIIVEMMKMLHMDLDQSMAFAKDVDEAFALYLETHYNILRGSFRKETVEISGRRIETVVYPQFIDKYVLRWFNTVFWPENGYKYLKGH